MKIMISNDQGAAHYFIRMGYLRAFNDMGHQCILWDTRTTPTFDAFDKFEPDLFWGQSYNLTPSIIKCIEERPLMQVILRAADRSSFSDQIKKHYDILTANQKEISLVNELREKTGKPAFLHNHYPDKYLQQTHADWIADGYKVVSLMNAADSIVYDYSSFQPGIKSDVVFVGGYLPLKSRSINENLMPLCDISSKIDVKVFGNSSWGIPQYHGGCAITLEKFLYRSAKVCANLSEQHARDFGHDVNERYFKTLFAGGICVADYVEGAAELLGEHVSHCKTPQEFRDACQYWIDLDYNDPKRIEKINKSQSFIAANHTYHNRVKTLLENL